MDFIGNHILSISQFNRVDVERIFDVADQMRPYAMRQRITRVLEGAIVSNMFFEPSTPHPGFFWIRVQSVRRRSEGNN